MFDTDRFHSSIAQAQLLNLPISVLGIVLIGVSGFLADSARFPRPVYPLTFLSVILICYGVLFAYPSNGAVYAATMIANACAAAWFPMMWPWRVQTTSRATGSAFSIGFVNVTLPTRTPPLVCLGHLLTLLSFAPELWADRGSNSGLFSQPQDSPKNMTLTRSIAGPADIPGIVRTSLQDRIRSRYGYCRSVYVSDLSYLVGDQKDRKRNAAIEAGQDEGTEGGSGRTGRRGRYGSQEESRCHRHRKLIFITAVRCLIAATWWEET